MELHPPAFKCRHQRLNFLRLPCHGVPEQETHCGAHDQHDKSTQRSGLVLRFKIQVEKRRHPTKHDEHFIQITDRDVPDICAQQVAFKPAHHRSGQRHGDGHPHQTRGDQLPAVGTALGENSHPIESSRHKEQHAHPQNRGLAG